VGVLLIGAHLSLSLLSRRFAYGTPFAERPVLWTALVMVAAGAVYLLAVASIPRTPDTGSALGWAFAVGLAARLVLLPSTPILEDDHYRYLWDGGVVAHGQNPYVWSPEAVHAAAESGDSAVPEGLRILAWQSGLVIQRVNHPYIRTIYPPVAQAAFALAHRLCPWSLTAWRAVVLLFDGATLVLLLLLLRQVGRPLLWATVYWWNPLIVKEFLNSAHMDAVVLPFLLGAVLLSLRGRHVPAACSLALAAGAKVWPVLLLPLLLRPLLSHPRKLATASLAFAGLTVALYWPMLRGGFGHDAGAVAYGRVWEMNDALFMVFSWLARAALKLVHADPDLAGLTARLAVAGIVLALALWVAWARPADGSDLCRRCLIVVAALFLLSPTQFPWYYAWLVPLLALRPQPSLLLLTAVLPLYYVRFRLAAMGEARIFDYGIVWLEYAPVWALLLWEMFRARVGRRAPGACVA